MTAKTVYAYPGSPVPQRSYRKSLILGLAACVVVALVGWCDTCRSLAVHRGRCEDQVRLLASEEAETEALF